ncbi:MAG TPA: hypothetical protein EYH54_06690 [Nautiliaceae bacterium]|nr:hypothetical protein [Nautiliaceae bacterium]
MEKKADIELLMTVLGLLLIGISLFLTAYGISKRLTTDINVFRLTDILEFSYLAVYTGDSYEINFGDIKSFSIGNDTIKLENVCLKKEENQGPLLFFLGESMIYYYNFKGFLEKVEPYKTIKLISKVKKLPPFMKEELFTLITIRKTKDILSFFSWKRLRNNLLLYLGIKAAENIHTIYSKINFKCVIIGEEFKLGKFYDYDIVIRSNNKQGQKINFSVEIENKKLVVNLDLKKFFD